jgi:hypothetical protein
VDEGGMREAVRDVHDFFLLDVVKKVSRIDRFKKLTTSLVLKNIAVVCLDAWTAKSSRLNQISILPVHPPTASFKQNHFAQSFKLFLTSIVGPKTSILMKVAIFEHH